MSRDYYRTFCIGRRPDGTKVRMDCLDSTAQFFGWDQVLKFHRLPWEPPPANGRYFLSSEAIAFETYGGRRMRISLSRDRHSVKAQQAKRFRVSKYATLKDLAFLASVTVPEFGWMTDQEGRRVFREDWLELHAAATAA